MANAILYVNDKAIISFPEPCR